MVSFIHYWKFSIIDYKWIIPLNFNVLTFQFTYSIILVSFNVSNLSVSHLLHHFLYTTNNLLLYLKNMTFLLFFFLWPTTSFLKAPLYSWTCEAFSLLLLICGLFSPTQIMSIYKKRKFCLPVKFYSKNIFFLDCFCWKWINIFWSLLPLLQLLPGPFHNPPAQIPTLSISPIF